MFSCLASAAAFFAACSALPRSCALVVSQHKVIPARIGTKRSIVRTVLRIGFLLINCFRGPRPVLVLPAAPSGGAPRAWIPTVPAFGRHHEKLAALGLAFASH